MTPDQILMRIQHYRYNVTFGTLDLAPLANDIVITSNKKIYDANIFVNGSVNEDGFLLREELKIRVASKYIAGIVPLLQRLADGQLLPEEELKLISRHPQGITLIFPCARLTGSEPWQLNTQEDQAVTLEFLARADATGKVVKIV